MLVIVVCLVCIERDGIVFKLVKKFFCDIGWHWMENHLGNFTDKVSGKTVYNAECAICKKEYMVDTLFPIASFKVRRKNNWGMENVKEITIS